MGAANWAWRGGRRQTKTRMSSGVSAEGGGGGGGRGGGEGRIESGFS